MQMATSRPPHNIPEEMLMQHFIGGLKSESAHFMNVTSKGSVMYKIVVEVRTILLKVLNNTQYMGVFDDPPEPTDQPKENQQVRIISTASSPRPPYIEEITELSKSTNHEPLIEDMPMFIPDLFTEEEYVELGNTSNFPKEHKCICSRSEAFIPNATP
jgi:cytoskeletal protein RodZ